MTSLHLASVALAASAMLVNAVPLDRRDVQSEEATKTTQDWRPWRYNDDDDNDYDYDNDDDDWSGRRWGRPGAWNEWRHRQDPYRGTWNVKKGVNSVDAASHRGQWQDGPWNPISGILGVLGGLLGEPEPTYIIVQGAPAPGGYALPPQGSYAGGYAVPPKGYTGGVAIPPQGYAGGVAVPPQGYAGGVAVPPQGYAGGVALPPGYVLTPPKGVPVAPGSGGARPKGWPPVIPGPTGIVATLPGGTGIQGLGLASAGFSLDGTSGAASTGAPVLPPVLVPVLPTPAPLPRPAGAPGPAGIVGTLQSGAGIQGLGLGSAGFSLDGTSGAATPAPVLPPVAPMGMPTPAPVLPRPAGAPGPAGIVGTLQSGAGIQGLGLASAGFSLDGAPLGASPTPAAPILPPVAPPAAVTPAPVLPPLAVPTPAGIVGTVQSGAGIQGLGLGSAGFSLDGTSGAATPVAPAVGALPALVTPRPAAAAAPGAAGINASVQSGAGVQGLSLANAGFSLDGAPLPATPAAPTPVVAAVPSPAAAAPSGVGAQGLGIGASGFKVGE